MNTAEKRIERGDIEDIRLRISKLFSQCLDDIEHTVSEAGLNMREVGVDLEKYVLCGDKCIVELKLQM